MNSTFEFFEEVMDTVPLNFYGSDVDVVVRRLGGAGGPVGANEKVFKD